MVRRAWLLAVAAVVLAGVADAQYVRPARMDETGWLAMGAPAGATTGCVGVFLGSPLNLQCDAGIGYDAATDTLTTGTVLAKVPGVGGTLKVCASNAKFTTGKFASSVFLSKVSTY